MEPSPGGTALSEPHQPGPSNISSGEWGTSAEKRAYPFRGMKHILTTVVPGNGFRWEQQLCTAQPKPLARKALIVVKDAKATGCVPFNLRLERGRMRRRSASRRVGSWQFAGSVSETSPEERRRSRFRSPCRCA